VLVKPNIGGSGAGIMSFDSPKELGEAADAGELEFGRITRRWSRSIFRHKATQSSASNS